jgi:hypothetical protein
VADPVIRVVVRTLGREVEPEVYVAAAIPRVVRGGDLKVTLKASDDQPLLECAEAILAAVLAEMARQGHLDSMQAHTLAMRLAERAWHRAKSDPALI